MAVNSGVAAAGARQIAIWRRAVAADAAAYLSINEHHIPSDNQNDQSS
jgi:hypothetical protein